MKNVNNTKPKTAIIYVRVSSKEQVANFSLDSQEKVCRDFATKKGYEVLEVYREEGESAKTADRTQLQLMLKYSEKNKNKIGIIIFHGVSRMSRITADYLALKNFFNRINISLVSATEGFEDSPVGKFLETMLSANAELENNVKSQKTIEGMRARVLKGYFSSKAPWAYVNTKDGLNNKIIKPDPEKAPIVRMLFEEYATGKYTFKELAQKVNKTGLKSQNGIKFYKQLVSKIIKNPIYYGWLSFPKFGLSVKGNHEPIISEKLFKEAQSARNKLANRKSPRNKDNQDFPLRGIKCSNCGKIISGGKTRGRKKYYLYYGCSCYECSKRTAIKKEDLENDFTVFLKEITPDNDLFKILKETIRLAYKQEFESTIVTKNKCESRIAEIKNDKDKLFKMRMDGEISTEEFTTFNNELKSKMLEQETLINELYVPELDLENVIDSSLEFLKNLPKGWRELDVKDLRVLRNLIFPKNVEYTYPGIKTAELSIVYKLKSEFADNEKRFVPLAGIEPTSKP